MEACVGGGGPTCGASNYPTRNGSGRRGEAYVARRGSRTAYVRSTRARASGEGLSVDAGGASSAIEHKRLCSAIDAARPRARREEADERERELRTREKDTPIARATRKASSNMNCDGPPPFEPSPLMKLRAPARVAAVSLTAASRCRTTLPRRGAAGEAVPVTPSATEPVFRSPSARDSRAAVLVLPFLKPPVPLSRSISALQHSGAAVLERTGNTPGAFAPQPRAHVTASQGQPCSCLASTPAGRAATGSQERRLAHIVPRYASVITRAARTGDTPGALVSQHKCTCQHSRGSRARARTADTPGAHAPQPKRT